MCDYCIEDKEYHISGKNLIVALTETTKLNSRYCKPTCFILKGKNDNKAGLMIDNWNGCSYVDINYCPMCGRKLGD